MCRSQPFAGSAALSASELSADAQRASIRWDGPTLSDELPTELIRER